VEAAPEAGTASPDAKRGERSPHCEKPRQARESDGQSLEREDALMQPRPWHAKARELRAAGVSINKTAAACDISVTQLKRFLYPHYKAKQMECAAIRRQDRLTYDPAYREHCRQLHINNARLARRRKDAKCEAYDTGRKYEDVCAAWEITP
jgi:hypothetical protein